MRHTTTSTGEQLANALHALGVNFIRGGRDIDEPLPNHPAQLIEALAQSDEARLRLVLIPLFLEHPEYASRVRAAAKKYQLKTALPDYFSKDLDLILGDDIDENLRALAERHAELSGSYVNRLATYQHAEQIWWKSVERRRKVTHG